MSQSTGPLAEEFATLVEAKLDRAMKANPRMTAFQRMEARQAAIRAVTRENPKLHASMIREQNPEFERDLQVKERAYTFK